MYNTDVVLPTLFAILGLLLGFKLGFKKGMAVSANNSQVLLDQLKKANQFATELREEDKMQGNSDTSRVDLN